LALQKNGPIKLTFATRELCAASQFLSEITDCVPRRTFGKQLRQNCPQYYVTTVIGGFNLTRPDMFF
jgi:hypothetical protein